MPTETLHLFKGTITLTDDAILVEGDNVRKDFYKKHTGVFLLGVSNAINTLIQYNQYVYDGRPEKHRFSFFLALTLILFFMLLFSVLRLSLSNNINLHSIKKVMHTVNSSIGNPVVHLYLNNHKIRQLHFESTEDLYFIEALKRRGICVKNSWI